MTCDWGMPYIIQLRIWITHAGHICSIRVSRIIKSPHPVLFLKQSKLFIIMEISLLRVYSVTKFLNCVLLYQTNNGILV